MHQSFIWEKIGSLKRSLVFQRPSQDSLSKPINGRGTKARQWSHSNISSVTYYICKCNTILSIKLTNKSMETTLLTRGESGDHIKNPKQQGPPPLSGQCSGYTDPGHKSKPCPRDSQSSYLPKSCLQVPLRLSFIYWACIRTNSQVCHT